jgi:Ran GTPase-activating protein (RanGAP) involved in mRNA processing and transport
METQKTICPVTDVNFLPVLSENIAPICDYLQHNDPLPILPLIFPIGTVTNDGRLDLCKQNLGIEGAKLIVNALKDNTCVKHLLLGTNKIGNEGAKMLSQVIQQNHALETLYLGCNHIEAEGAIAICEALEANTDIKSVWFKRNPIGKKSVPALIQLLKKNKNIATLDLVNTCLEDGFLDLFDYFMENTTVERLYLSGNYLTINHLKKLGNMLAHNTALKALFVSVNAFGDEGAKYLAHGLAKNAILEELSVASCGIRADGMVALVEGLSKYKNLTYLDAGYASSTRALHSQANEIDDLAAEKLLQLVEKSPKLTHVSLAKTNISAAYKAQFANLKEKNIVMDGFTHKNAFPAHPHSKAIKSVYR